MSLECAVTTLSGQIFDLLDGPFANLGFDSTCVTRPLRLELLDTPVHGIVLRWPVGTPLALTDLRLCATPRHSRGTQPASLMVETDCPDAAFALKDAEVSQLGTAPRDGMYLARLTFAAQPAAMLVLERAQNHQPLPRDFTVHVESADAPPTCLFDQTALQDGFVAAVKALPEAGKYARSVRILIRQTMAVVMGNYAATRASYKKMIDRLGHGTFQAFAAVANDRWLNARDHEYAQHGISNTFRYWSPRDIETFLTDISTLAAKLDSHGIPAIACYGTLLGPVRDGGLIPHDDDADILCINTDAAVDRMTFLAKLAGIAALNGFSVRKISGGMDFVQLLTPSGRQVDFFACDMRSDGCHLKPARHRPTDRSAIFPIKTGQIMGMPMPFPNDEKALLHDIYGDGWTVPQPYFLHQWR